MDREKVLQLATLARIRLTDDEAEALSKDFDSILNYVSEIKTSGVSPRKDLGEPLGLSSGVRNVMREDGAGHESGVYTEKLLAQAPARQENYFKVKKIL